MNFDELLKRGYKEFKPSLIYHANRACQKSVKDSNENILYFITVYMYDLRGTKNYETHIQFYQKGTHNALDLNFLNGWAIEDIEKYADFIYCMGTQPQFEPYEYSFN